mmetsp:Transcript_19072/g.47161  ORF Transcript_19072/g.47161 Transcript_19072/m.47161 type:complete len:143 (+) Transcript_19072:53-481(+)
MWIHIVDVFPPFTAQMARISLPLYDSNTVRQRIIVQPDDCSVLLPIDSPIEFCQNQSYIKKSSLDGLPTVQSPNCTDTSLVSMVIARSIIIIMSCSLMIVASCSDFIHRILSKSILIQKTYLRQYLVFSSPSGIVVFVLESI